MALVGQPNFEASMWVVPKAASFASSEAFFVPGMPTGRARTFATDKAAECAKKRGKNPHLVGAIVVSRPG
jgi:hypothetical protein